VNQQTAGAACSACQKTPPGLFQRYKGFLLAPGTILTYVNALLMVFGFVAEIAGQAVAARWLFLASAIVGGAPIFKLAAVNIFTRFDLTAGVMVSIAMIAAMIVGEYSAAAMVAFMMLVGEMLENYTLARADNALNELESLLPATVVLRQTGRDVEVAIEAVRAGDLALIRPGGRVPVDGVVQAGNAAIDQSSITGESIPVDVSIGDRVYAGTLCTSGSIDVLVEQVGESTTLGQMVELVKQARSTQAPVQRVASKYAQYLTPLAILIAVLTWWITRDVTRAITVLIVICPCSLVLATPTAVVAAIGNAARRGVLVKHGPAMERIGKVDVIALDKTGTVTLGEPRLQQTLSLNGMSPLTVLAYAAGAERSSEHPLARAIVDAAHAAELDLIVPEAFQAIPGHGVCARVQGQEVAIGERMLQQLEIAVSPEAQLQITELQAAGNTVVPVAVAGAVAGLLVIADTVREEAVETIARLKSLGVRRTVLISGDSQAVAEAVGRALDVDLVYGEILPEGKLGLVRELQSGGRRTVAFVGDGVNDAPALAAADVGIAMGGIGTNVAMETADILLLTDHLDRLPYLVDLSRVTLKTILVNVIFAMSMNLLSVALSIGGVIGPVVGAVMHEVSALPVVANSARLINWKRK